MRNSITIDVVMTDGTLQRIFEMPLYKGLEVILERMADSQGKVKGTQLAALTNIIAQYDTTMAGMLNEITSGVQPRQYAYASIRKRYTDNLFE